MIDDLENHALGLQLKKNKVSLENLPKLAKNQVHLWCIELALKPQQKRTALSLLSPYQLDKFKRRNQTASANAYLAGRYYLTQLLAAYTQSAADTIELAYTRLHKPYLTHYPQLHFNLSDTFVASNRAFGVFGFALERKIGVDIERADRQGRFQAIAARRFTASEQAFVARHQQVEQARFMQIWTRKEAFGKAKGVGINFTMRDYDFSAPTTEFGFTEPDGSAWRFMQIEMAPQLIGCVVLNAATPFDCQLFSVTS